MRSIHQVTNQAINQTTHSVFSNSLTPVSTSIYTKTYAKLRRTVASAAASSIVTSTTILLLSILCLVSLTSCTSGESATSSGGASFTNIGGNWQGMATPSNRATPVNMSLSIVFTSESIINGTASFGSEGAPCLISGPLTGTAANGQVTFTVTGTTLTFAGVASTDHMEGTFVATATTSTSTTDSAATCQGQSGNWRVSR